MRQRPFRRGQTERELAVANPMPDVPPTTSIFFRKTRTSWLDFLEVLLEFDIFEQQYLLASQTEVNNRFILIIKLHRK